jgi:RNA polymerase sigma factor (sigma-70 family)
MELPSSIWTVILSVRQDPERVKDLIVRRYRQPVYDFIRMKGLNHEDAEDVTQEVFVRICREEFLEKADRDKGKFRTLLLAVTRNMIAFFRRFELSERRDRRRQISLANMDLPAQEEPDKEFDALWVKNLVTQAMERLQDDPTVRALALQMEGKSYQEIADALGKQVTDVTNYIHRAKLRLRGEIERMISGYSTRDQVPEEIAELIKHF